MAEEQQQSLYIQRIYVKDLSLETPGTPQIFREEWQPEINMDLSIRHEPLEENFYEIVLSITTSAKKGEQSIFLVEAHLAGIFHIEGFNTEQQNHILNVYCPTVLFPYVREVISDMTTRASFPPLQLAPVNFDALYKQQQDEEKKGKAEIKTDE